MVRSYLNRRILVGFLIALSILSWLAVSSFYNTKELLRSNDLVVHTLDVLYNTERVMSVTTNIELGQRGYTITGNEQFLATYRKASQEIDQHLENLRILTSDNASQRARVDELKTEIGNLIIFSTDAIEKRKSGFHAAREANASMEGKRTLDHIRAIIAEIEAEEHDLLTTRNALNERYVNKFNFTFIILLIATGLILVAISYAINVNLKRRIKTENQLKVAMAEISDLYDNAPCGYHSIDKEGYFVAVNSTLCKWLGYTKSEMLNKLKFADIIVESDHVMFRERFEQFKNDGEVYDLDFCMRRKNGSEFPVILSAIAIKDEDGNYVKSRSITIDNTDRKLAEIKVKNLNHELEAFTYSVSHDLRAPLRSIDGYARILQEDYGEKLDAEAQRLLNVVINNARRMGKLIDDLLDFARLGRKDLVRSNVNMTVVVNNIVKELVEQEKPRVIEVAMQPLHNVPVDVDMIRQVWENLISNALKYSSKREVTKIKIQSELQDGVVIYSVEDNGVGFDMQYVGKLFGVFQRLHKIQDFSGTGVGLAIVKRIIDRHQGKVWAEGRVNEGANFYFSIPNENGK